MTTTVPRRDPEAWVDVLSDVLLSVRLTGAVFFAVDAADPFVTEAPDADSVHLDALAGVEHVIPFHVVTEGACWAQRVGPGEAAVRLTAGDMVIFPAGDANVLASTPGMRGRPDPTLYSRPPDRALPFPLRTNPDSAAVHTRFVCGFLGCDRRPFNPLLTSLPRMVHAPVSHRSRQWVVGLVAAAVEASGGGDAAGREAMLAKLAELMFVEALRSHLTRLPEDERGWLAGVRDPQVGAALRLMHGRPAAPWTLESLAHDVGMSRSAFAERFTSFVHIPPMQYLAHWRLQLGARMLEAGTMTVSQVASAVGYQSEPAFNRAFKRQVGLAPGAWRRDHLERP